MRSNAITIPRYRFRLHNQAGLVQSSITLTSCPLLPNTEDFFNGWFEYQTGLHLQLGLSFCPAGDVPLDLSLVHAIHGQPHQRPANHQAPEGVSLSWVQIQAGGRHQTLPVLMLSYVSQFND